MVSKADVVGDVVEVALELELAGRLRQCGAKDHDARGGSGIASRRTHLQQPPTAKSAKTSLRAYSHRQKPTSIDIESTLTINPPLEADTR